MVYALAMPDEPPAESEEPQPRDERWDELRVFVKATMGIGITDVSEMTEIINATKTEDLRADLNKIIERLTKPLFEWLKILQRFEGLVEARELMAEKQTLTEAALLDRIKEVSKETDSPDGLHSLAAAYAQLRYLSVAPGFYTPDIRHTDDVDLE